MYKKKFKIAIILDQKLDEGGGYQQSLNSALLAKKLKDDMYTLKFFTIFKNDIEKLEKFKIKAEYLNLTFYLKFITFLSINPKIKAFKNLLKLFLDFNPFYKILKKRDIDLVYFLSPSKYAICLGNLNFIYTIWDICHRDNPEFPEVRNNYEFEKREYIYKKLLPKSTGIIVDSNVNKDNLSQLYNINKDKIIVIPFEATPSIKDFSQRKLNKKYLNTIYKIESPYIFYPAQFWAHKNHIYILESIAILKKLYGIKMNIVFSGSNKGNLNYIKKSVNLFGLENQVRFMGFVNNDLLINLYRNSFALVMPTYFGPTNLPPLEAFKLGIPVIYPDIKEMREQIGNAAKFINLLDPKSLANEIKNLYKNETLRKKIIKAGFKRSQEIENIDREKELSNLIRKFCSKRKCWD